MPSLRSNAIRIKRFRELKETLRTDRERLLVGIDIAKAQHVAQLRVAHGRLVVPRLVIPNTTEGFTAFWRQLQAAQRTSGCPEIVCALEPTGTYHEALGRFLESQGADVVLVANQVAHANRKTLDGTWGKSDPKDAHNLCELLERGLVRFYSLPEGPLAELRRLVRLLRRARVERAACQVRWRNTLRPALGPAGEPLPAAVCAQLPAALRAFERATEASAARGRAGRPVPLPPGFAAECTDLVARLTAAQARIATLEAALVEVAAPLPAYRLLLTLPGIGPTLAAILLAEIGDIAWYTKFSQLRKLAGLDIIWVESGEWAGTPRISRAGRSGGRSTRRPSGPPSAPPGGPAAPPSSRSGRGIGSRSSRRPWNSRRSSCGSCGASGAVGAPTTRRARRGRPSPPLWSLGGGGPRGAGSRPPAPESGRLDLLPLASGEAARVQRGGTPG